MAPPNDIYIFPLIPDEPPRDANPAIAHPPQPTSTPNNYSYPTIDPPQILVYYRGPVKRWMYNPRNPPLPHYMAHRINLSIESHLRRAGLPARNRPPILEVGTPIEANYIDFRLDMNLITTRTEFGLLLQDLAPPVAQNARMFTVSQWDIVCRRCGTAVTHYCTDDDWNGRYLSHRKEKYCRDWEPSAIEANIAEIEAIKAGNLRYRESIWEKSGTYY